MYLYTVEVHRKSKEHLALPDDLDSFVMFNAYLQCYLA